MKLKKGDTVVVVSGKDKGKQGTIMTALPDMNRVVVDGVGLVKRHLRRATRGQSAGIVERPRPIDASNVMLLDPKDGKPTRVGRKIENGKVVRVAKKSGTTLS
ncbi:MAG TPA: 50S ribosomal protein L24 [Candidatus Paceibacterota bacterium]